MQRFRKLHNALVSVKPMLSTTEPCRPSFLVNRQKQQVIRRSTMDQVHKENKLLLKKMDAIHARKSYQTQLYSSKRPLVSASVPKFPIQDGLSRKSKLFQESKITQDNKILMHKIMGARSHYPVDRFMQDADKNSAYRVSISTNARRVKHQPADDKLQFLYENRPVSRAATAQAGRKSAGLGMSSSASRLPRPSTSNAQPVSPKAGFLSKSTAITGFREIKPDLEVF